MRQPDAPDPTTSALGEDAWATLLNELVAAIPEELLHYDSLPDAVTEFVHDALPEVQHQVQAYADITATTRDSDLAITLLEAAQDLAMAAPIVDLCTAAVIAQRLRDLGFTEAHRGTTEPDVRHAASLLARHAWHAISRYATEAGWKAGALGNIGTLLFTLREHAEELVVAGYRSVPRPAGGPSEKRRQLIAALLADDSIPEPRRTRELRSRARAAQWEVPANLVVLRFRAAPGAPPLGTRGALVDNSVAPVRVIAADTIAEETIRLLADAGAAPIAVSPWTAPALAGSADRLAKRAIALSESGVITAAPVIRCDEHASLLWLHAEPEIRSQMTQELLSPLLAEHPTSRMALAETMLIWLTTRDSAPAIAERLGVHPQTVRYRWRRLQELFGDRLLDPEFVTTVALLLRATVPMWQRGQLADVEAFSGLKAGPAVSRHVSGAASLDR